MAIIEDDIINQMIESIIDDISDRHGLGDEWGNIDDDTKAEIREAWAQIMRIYI